MVLVPIPGRMVTVLKVNGLKERDMEEEFAVGLMAVPMTVNGRREKSMVPVFTPGAEVIVTKDNGLKTI
jgi:hypothetical protein